MDGINESMENCPEYVIESISQGYDVEIDVHIKNGNIFLGHDKPQHEVGPIFLKKFSPSLWCHAKTALALKMLIKMDMNCFFHETDAVVLTSKKYLWTYPGAELVKGAIAVLPEIHNDNIEECAGVCSDFVKRYKERSV